MSVIVKIRRQCKRFENCEENIFLKDFHKDRYALRRNHTERQEERQGAAAASPMQVYGDASLDTLNGPQIHCINLTLYLPLTLDAPLDARCVYTFRGTISLIIHLLLKLMKLQNKRFELINIIQNFKYNLNWFYYNFFKSMN